MAGTEHEVRISMDDGVELAATLYLPDPVSGPQPCLLEALPYRKDDLTSSYAEGYLSLRDTYGYAVCRVDLRGTGSSSGDGTDEYPPVERADMCTVIGWLAEQDWCNGNVGMWGTSYSGFNSLQVAAERPPALKAICSIFASDDRWRDDVHWRGAALKLVDLVDYNHYMTPMSALPPVPAVWGEGWREEWLRRIEICEPWGLTWLRENRDGDYWRAGSLRRADGTGYERIECPVMLVTGWADGYRNISFRSLAPFAEAGVPFRVLAGPWAHADPATAMPGPRIDLDAEMAAWWDRWLRGTTPDEHQDHVDVFVRTSTVPEVDLELHGGFWVRDVWPSPATSWSTLTLEGARSLDVRPDVGTSAWIDCAGHLPWGQSGDQRIDDAFSLTWDLAPPEQPIIGQPRVRLRVSASAPAASLSVKLCDVFPDGTSALVARGSVDLMFRDDVHGSPSPLVPGQVYDVHLELDACAFQWSPGQRLRVSIAGSDWPNTIAPPAPVTLTIHGGELDLPLWSGTPQEPPAFRPGAESSSEDPAGVTWSITDDVISRTTTATVRTVSGYDVPYDGHATETYDGTVSVDRRTFEQRAHADCTFELSWPGIDITVASTMTVRITGAGYDVEVDVTALEGDTEVGRRSWQERIPR